VTLESIGGSNIEKLKAIAKRNLLLSAVDKHFERTSDIRAKILENVWEILNKTRKVNGV
jgi:hypothetical protein